MESKAVDDFLEVARNEPTALILDGEAGIGKTTVWLAGCEKAERAGFLVLSTRASAAESVLAYASLATLIDGLDDEAFAELPPPQRLAIDRVLMKVNDDGPGTEQRAVSAAFLSIIENLATTSPVVIAIDDVQWVDPASTTVFASALRRLTGPVGVLATMRDEPELRDVGSWIELRRPTSLQRIRLRPLTIGALHTVLSERLGRSFARPKMRRIHEFSGGNPFYALEFGRAMAEDSWHDELNLPGTLAELVRARLAGLTAEGRNALLAIASLADPTVELISRATSADVETTIAALEEAETRGIIQVDGQRVTFSHPLLTRGVYAEAEPARRRRMHKRLAEIIDEPELKARHLARSAARADEPTLRSLDIAADSARARGAPAAAAEFVDLARKLGGDTPERRIRSAGYHFEAGDPGHARTLLDTTVANLEAGVLRANALKLLAVVRLYDDSFAEAAEILVRAIGESSDDPTSQVQMKVMLAFAEFNGGRVEPAVHSAEDAVAQASRLGRPDLLSQALSMRVMLRFLVGEGLDEQDLDRALELDDDPVDVPIAIRPRVLRALLQLWTDRHDDAADALATTMRRSIERGEESELIFLGFHTALLQVWRGKLTDAELLAEDLMERALQLNGDLPLFIALTVRATVSAYLGREAQVRQDVANAMAASERCGSHRLAEWPVTALGFLEVSKGDHQAALAVLTPLITKLDTMPQATEIVAASFIPDAAEAMVGLGRLQDAEKLIDVIERNGQRLDRAWMLAVGARCRSMLLAATGDVQNATVAIETALRHHRRLPMPFELARTQLLLGQVQRRQRQREAASVSLRSALATFEELGTQIWADRTRGELNRASGTRAHAELTASELRVAELAASGMSNKDMAAALFISPKTVEANLSRIYRKLNIRSRAELGRVMGGGTR